MTAATQRVVIVGEGARAGALVRAWLGLDAPPRLAWNCRGDRAALERSLGRAIEGSGAGLRVGDREFTQVDASEPDDVVIELDPIRVRVPGQSELRFEPAAILAIAPVLQALDRGPGLRWASLSLIEGRVGSQAPLGIVEGDATSLDQAFARKLPSLVGRVALSLARGPQLGTRIELVTLLGGSSSEVVDDLLEHLARTTPGEVRAHAPHDSALVMGDARVWIARSPGVGPLARIVAHLDPEAALAKRVWTRITSRG